MNAIDIRTLIGQPVVRHQRFASGGAHINARTSEGLSLEELGASIPSILATQAHESRSSRFVPIPTSQVIAGLMREGFRPFEGRQGGSRVAGKREFTKHMVRFRHPNMQASAAGLFPELILINANDGTAAYHLMAGIFRMVCRNGLIVGERFKDFRISHSGEPRRVIDNVIEASFSVIDESPRVLDSAVSMSGVALSQDEQCAFARAARSLRWAPDENGTQTAPIDETALLRPRRHDDAAPDLWTTFNRVQENLMRGGQQYRLPRTATNPRGRRMHVGAVNGIDQDRTLNRALWTLAEEMQRLKA